MLTMSFVQIKFIVQTQFLFFSICNQCVCIMQMYTVRLLSLGLAI